MIALLIGAGWVALVAIVLSFNWACSERRRPTPRSAGVVVLSERARMRRCPRRPTGVS